MNTETPPTEEGSSQGVHALSIFIVLLAVASIFVIGAPLYKSSRAFLPTHVKWHYLEVWADKKTGEALIHLPEFKGDRSLYYSVLDPSGSYRNLETLTDTFRRFDQARGGAMRYSGEEFTFQGTPVRILQSGQRDENGVVVWDTKDVFGISPDGWLRRYIVNEGNRAGAVPVKSADVMRFRPAVSWEAPAKFAEVLSERPPYNPAKIELRQQGRVASLAVTKAVQSCPKELPVCNGVYVAFWGSAVKQLCDTGSGPAVCLAAVTW